MENGEIAENRIYSQESWNSQEIILKLHGKISQHYNSETLNIEHQKIKKAKTKTRKARQKTGKHQKKSTIRIAHNFKILLNLHSAGLVDVPLYHVDDSSQEAK